MSDVKVEISSEIISTFKETLANLITLASKDRKVPISSYDVEFASLTSTITCIIFTVEVNNYIKRYDVIEGIRRALDINLTPECRTIISELTPSTVN